MHLSSKTKEKMGSMVDEYGDFFFETLDVSDLQQVHLDSLVCKNFTSFSFASCH